MTNMPEAKLAREAEMSYATIALATDYDCWHEEEEAVSVEAVVALVRRNAVPRAEDHQGGGARNRWRQSLSPALWRRR